MRRRARPLALSDNQLQRVMLLAGPLSPEKRSTFLERLAPQLERLGRFSDDDLDRVAQSALRGLLQRAAS
jgi:hypothetical protein